MKWALRQPNTKRNELLNARSERKRIFLLALQKGQPPKASVQSSGNCAKANGKPLDTQPQQKLDDRFCYRLAAYQLSY